MVNGFGTLARAPQSFLAWAWAPKVSCPLISFSGPLIWSPRNPYSPATASGCSGRCILSFQHEWRHLYLWLRATQVQLGHEDTQGHSCVPRLVEALVGEQIQTVAAGDRHVLFCSSSGLAVFATGNNFLWPARTWAGGSLAEPVCTTADAAARWCRGDLN